MKSHQQKIHNVFVPYAIAQPVLLSGVLYIASRRYGIVANNSTTVDRYLKMMLHYKLACLQVAIGCVALEKSSSDATVALTLILASEAVRINLPYCIAGDMV